MKSSIKIIENGSISSPKGFRSGAIFAGIKTPGEDKKDIGILARNGFSFETSKRIMDLSKDEYEKIIRLL